MDVFEKYNLATITIPERAAQYHDASFQPGTPEKRIAQWSLTAFQSALATALSGLPETAEDAELLVQLGNEAAQRSFSNPPPGNIAGAQHKASIQAQALLFREQTDAAMRHVGAIRAEQLALQVDESKAELAELFTDAFDLADNLRGVAGDIFDEAVTHQELVGKRQAMLSAAGQRQNLEHRVELPGETYRGKPVFFAANPENKKEAVETVLRLIVRRLLNLDGRGTE